MFPRPTKSQRRAGVADTNETGQHNSLMMETKVTAKETTKSSILPLFLTSISALQKGRVDTQDSRVNGDFLTVIRR